MDASSRSLTAAAAASGRSTYPFVVWGVRCRRAGAGAGRVNWLTRDTDVYR